MQKRWKTQFIEDWVTHHTPHISFSILTETHPDHSHLEAEGISPLSEQTALVAEREVLPFSYMTHLLQKHVSFYSGNCELVSVNKDEWFSNN